MSVKDELQEAVEQFPTAQDFFLNVSLYKAFPVNLVTLQRAALLLKFNAHLDMFCLECKAMSVFNCSADFQYLEVKIDSWHHREFLMVRCICSRDKSHEGAFYFRLNEHTGIQKIGQYPSAADVSSFDVKKYAKVLSKEGFSGLKTAIGLSAHGVGAGALVYLRQIFESLIVEAHDIASKEQDWDEDIYSKGRMQDRVKLLRNYLPDFLVEHHKLYGILSHGIHEMPEDQCREYFPVLRMSIELILDQKLMELEKQRKIAEAAAFITRFDQA